MMDDPPNMVMADAEDQSVPPSGEREERLREALVTVRFERQVAVGAEGHLRAEAQRLRDLIDPMKPDARAKYEPTVERLEKAADGLAAALASSPSPPDGSLNPDCAIPDCKVPASWLVAGKWYCGAHTRDLAQRYESHVIPGYVSALERVARERDSHAFGHSSPPDREQEQLKEALRAMCQFTGEASRTRPLLMEARRRAIELCGYVDGFGPVRGDEQ